MAGNKLNERDEAADQPAEKRCEDGTHESDPEHLHKQHNTDDIADTAQDRHDKSHARVLCNDQETLKFILQHKAGKTDHQCPAVDNASVQDLAACAKQFR